MFLLNTSEIEENAVVAELLKAATGSKAVLCCSIPVSLVVLFHQVLKLFQLHLDIHY